MSNAPTLRGGERSSNLELFRIIVMALIVAHHYVVNSGLTAADGPVYAAPTSARSLFLLVFGAFGKIGIDCFVLITGYFMCVSNITAKKFAKLIGVVMFYKITIYLIFLATGRVDLSPMGAFKYLAPVRAIERNFVGCFLVFYLAIPFLNVLVKSLTEKSHLKLLALLAFIYVVLGTIKQVDFNYFSWFCVLYVVASHIRLYPKKIYENTKFWGAATACCLALCVGSVVACAWLGTLVDRNMAFFFVADSNTVLAIATGLASFMFFKNLKIKNRVWINAIAASTFAVLLIHANSDEMRKLLWRDTLNVVAMYDSDWLLLHAFGSVVGIFFVCVAIDRLRIRLVEEPFFRWWDKRRGSNAPQIDETGAKAS